MELNKAQEEILSDIIELENDSEKNAFGYLSENIIDEENNLQIIDSLEDGGYIRVDRLATSPVNVETSLLGREYFDAPAVEEENEGRTVPSVIFLIIGIIIGAIMMYFCLKYNII